MPKYLTPPKEPVKAIKISEEEFKRLTPIQEFELNNEAAILGYFIKNLHRTKYQFSPVNLRQFYLNKAVEALSQIKDKQTRKLLEDLVYSKTKH